MTDNIYVIYSYIIMNMKVFNVFCHYYEYNYNYLVYI